MPSSEPDGLPGSHVLSAWDGPKKALPPAPVVPLWLTPAVPLSRSPTEIRVPLF